MAIMLCKTIATKSISPTSGLKSGDKATYTISVKNTGAVNLTSLSLEDDMTNVLDDATYNNDASATSGTLTFMSPMLGWAGDLNQGQTATLTYSATVKAIGALGNGTLANAIGAGPMNCPALPISNPSDPDYSTTCAMLTVFGASTDASNPSAGSNSNFSIMLLYFYKAVSLTCKTL